VRFLISLKCFSLLEVLSIFLASFDLVSVETTVRVHVVMMSMVFSVQY
jgi:hypothetical protein